MEQPLPEETKLELVKFVSAMAWSDFEIREEERAHIRRLIQRLGLSAESAQAAEAWLETPDAVGDVDPNDIPREQRDLFFSEASRVMLVDGVLHEEEAETLDLLRRILFPEDDD